MLLAANDDTSSTDEIGSEEIDSFGQPDEHHSNDENEACIICLFFTLREHLLLEVKGFIFLVFLFHIVVDKNKNVVFISIYILYSSPFTQMCSSSMIYSTRYLFFTLNHIEKYFVIYLNQHR